MENNKMPLSVTLDIIAKDIEEYIANAINQTGVGADIIEFAVFKALSSIQRQKQYINSASYFDLAKNEDNDKKTVHIKDTKKLEEVLKSFQSPIDDLLDKGQKQETL